MTENALNITTTGLPIYDSSTGDFAAVALTTKGDALVHNGTDYIRLAKGTDGEVLQADSGEASGLNWGSLAFTGDLIPISKQTASTSTSIDFTGLDLSTYGTLFFNLVAVHPVTDNVSLQVLFSVDNGSTFLSTGYQYANRIVTASSGSGSETNSSSATNIITGNSIGNGTKEGVAGWFWYLPSSDPTNGMRQSIEWQLFLNNNNKSLVGLWGGGANTTTSAIDAIRFQFSSGSIESGDFYLYGYKAS